MNVVIIGRSELMFDTLLLAVESQFNVVGIISAKEAPEYRYTAEDFVGFAEERNIPCILTSKLDSEKGRSFFSKLKSIDLGLSVNFSGIIPQSVIDLFSIGILNAHGGDLPRYRGNACSAWALINGEEKIGLCVHKMIGGELDSGDIIGREYYRTNINTKVGEVWHWMNSRIPHMFLSAAKKLNQDPGYVLESQSKDPKNALRCYPRKPEDGKIDWTKSAEDVLRLINASGPPYHGSFTYLDGKKVFILGADLVGDCEIFFAIPGQVTSFNLERCTVVVACGVGKLRLTNLLCENGTSDFIINSTRQRFSND